MLFNSLQFLVFFPIVVALYFATPQRLRWVLLLAASYYFYACWKPEYLLLIVASTLVDYFCGLRMGRFAEQAKRKKWLVLSLCSNLGLLFAFKYFNFFNEAARAALNQFNIFYGVPAFDVLLPVGISFYTFQTLSYSIDVYRGRQQPERHLGIFALYVSFFPQLVAGPIERSTRLLPQFFQHHGFEYDRVASGLRLILWGFFKKVVIADRLAIYVNEVYGNPGAYDGPTILIATYFFAFQIYCDFSGYSDIAIGTARVMGYDLMQNFRRPYFARSISEFWQRWHISLSTWFRDYLYIPLGGNRVSPWRWYVNLFAVFMISGLWHGANWTFIVWGALHGSYLVFSLLTSDVRDRLWQWIEDLVPSPMPAPAPAAAVAHVARHAEVGVRVDAASSGLTLASVVTGAWFRGRPVRDPSVYSVARDAIAQPRLSSRVRGLVALVVTFHLVLLAWIFFRANSITEAFQLLGSVLTWSRSGQSIVGPADGTILFFLSCFVVGVLLAVQFVQHRWENRLTFTALPLPVRWACYYLLLFGILLVGEFGVSEFIYFQF